MPAVTLPVDAEIARRVAAEYQEMPGLSLTMSQAARLMGLPLDVCGSVVEALVLHGVLRLTTTGRLVLAD